MISANAPQQITLIDAGNFLYSDDGAVDVAISEQAAIQLNTTPTDPAVAATTTFESLWRHKPLGDPRHALGCVAAWAERQRRLHDRELLR